MKKKFVIVGATGAVGSSLTKLIKKKNLEAHLIAKNKDEVESLNQETGFSYTIADVLQEDYLEKVEKDLGAASMSIDMLSMIQEKTKGNLEDYESQLLEKTLNDLSKDSLSYWFNQWIATYDWILKQDLTKRKNLFFVCYESLCNDKQYFDNILRNLNLKPIISGQLETLKL